VAARVTQQPEEPQQAEEEESRVTTPADLGFRTREIEVDPIQEVAPQAPDDQGMVVIRMARTIEEFTYGTSVPVALKEGHRYRVPAHIGRYLDSLGCVYHM
jgi:hypothetical protein